MRVRVKICGLTNLEDASVAVEAGADALGFILYQGSQRCVTPEKAAGIIAQLPPFVAKVGVFVDEPLESIRHLARATGIDTLQLHGRESPAYCDALRAEGCRVIKAFRVKDSSSLDALNEYRAAAFLLDSYVPGQLGGTGAKFNWELVHHAKNMGRPIILAGGLDPENVADAIAKVAPFAVDVSSGVERSPGQKDPARVRAFIARAKAAG